MSVIFMRKTPGRLRQGSSSVPSFTLVPIPDEEEEFEDNGEERCDRISRCASRDDSIVRPMMNLTKSSISTRGSKVSWAQEPPRKLDKLLKHLDTLQQRLGLSHLIPVVLLVIYSLIGAALLLLVEAPYEEQIRRGEKQTVEKLRNEAVERLGVILKDKDLSMETKLYASRDLIIWYEQGLGFSKGAPMRWDMWGALFYVGTIFTTIGYGNIYPRSTSGRLLSIVYALIGVPLALAILNDLGTMFCKRINQFWSWAHRNRRDSLAVRANCDDSDENDDETPLEAIPVWLAVSLTLFWMLLCAGLFCAWEHQWNYFTALYFFFISLSTIGLGDITPNRPRLMVLNFGLVMVGLSLVSMTINVIQHHLEMFLYRMSRMIESEYALAQEAGVACNGDSLLANAMRKQPWYVRHLAPRVLGASAKERLRQCAESTANGTPLLMSTFRPDLYKKPAVRRRHASVETVPRRCVRACSVQTPTGIGSEERPTQTKPTTADSGVQTSLILEPQAVPFSDNEIQTSLYLLRPDTRDISSQAEAEQQARTTQTELETALQETEVQTDSSYLRKAKWLFDLTHLKANSLEVMAVPMQRQRRPPPHYQPLDNHLPPPV
ncbi:TWiK family of potassium channels protein 18 [Trichinella nelsoni]|uniref:TWiK family of potassium channels protein 18 n=1 Tax=Trichinella nelsoni TaxID=6336 RepID=A0A0V0S7G3_9BILA|nr:TWiK family of potassium channels protein 18 [Trichinella nelsoni]